MSERRVAVITGGATGIGGACTARFRQEGWNVVIGYYAEEERIAADRLIAEAEAAGCEAIAVRADVSKDDDCRALAAAAEQHFGRIDALVSSAGTTRMVPANDLEGLNFDDFIRCTGVNTAGPFQIARACARLLAEGAGGGIVIVSSYGGIFGNGSSIAYAASKGAANTLTLSLARVLAPKIRVNAVCPALVSGGMVHRMDPGIFDARAAAQAERAPLRKVAKPEEVAADIYWLAAGTTLMTGHIIMLDCGMHLNAE